MGIPGAQYVNQGLTVLHSSAALRSALGIKTLDVEHLLHVLQRAHAQQKLPQLGMQWCAQMLACIFEMLAAKEPSMRSMRAQDYSPTSAVQTVLKQLASLPVFPLTSGSWIAVGTDPGKPLFNAIALPASTAKSSPEAQRGTPNEGIQKLHTALKKCQLKVQDMQLHIVAEDFVSGAGSTAASLSKLMQVQGFLAVRKLDMDILIARTMQSATEHSIQ